MTDTWRQAGPILSPRSRCPRHRSQRTPLKPPPKTVKTPYWESLRPVGYTVRISVQCKFRSRLLRPPAKQTAICLCVSCPPCSLAPILCSLFDNLQPPSIILQLHRLYLNLSLLSFDNILSILCGCQTVGKIGRQGEKDKTRYKRASRQPREYKASTISSGPKFLRFQDTT